ncbi:ATP-binding protein [Microbacterium sp. F51-2R]|uniref:ATP-binding protein n=1 Tax=Microbacterium sp. F51-2R TaxID=3445777 RepID=UPI003F9F9771
MKPIIGFTVSDDGVGFTAPNMTSFETLDSDFKADLGCRGVGRLLWLKAFDKVSVRSAYEDEEGKLRARQFRFSVAHEVEHDGNAGGFVRPGAVVSLDGFKKTFQQNAPKGVDAIAREIFEHCIWYFLRPGGAPVVTVTDDDESVSLADLMDEFVDSAMTASAIEVKGQKFDMLNLRLKATVRYSAPRLHWCAASRVVLEENLSGKVPGLHGRLADATSGEFVYACYLTSDFLDERVRSDRTAFDISDRIAGQPLVDDLSLDDIREAVFKEVAKILKDPLESAREQGKQRVHDFVTKRAPRYRPVLAKIEERGITVDPSVKDQDLELQLHRHLQKIESEAFVQGQEIFAEADADAEPAEDYTHRLAAYLATVSEINQSDLAAYVSRRRTVLDLLSRLIRADKGGKYSREDAIHSLIVPMRTESNDVAADGSNLWIIDERLAFHDYLASDKTLKSMPVTGSESTREPDIFATRLIDSPVLAAEGQKLPLPSIVVVEIKRPMRKDATEDKNPIQQCLDYVKRIRAGGVMTATGRPIPPTQDPPAFCYIVADLTEKMIERCEISDLRPTHDGLGYFGYNNAAKAYVEVMSFDGLVNAATERNRAFFDKLGLPT